MQQLDNPEHHGRPQEALEDAKQPAGGTCEVMQWGRWHPRAQEVGGAHAATAQEEGELWGKGGAHAVPKLGGASPCVLPTISSWVGTWGR